MGNWRQGVKRLYTAIFGAPEPSWRDFLGYVGGLGVVAAGFGVYRGVWLLIIAGMAVAAAALPAAVWLQGREPTDPQVELPSTGVHWLYPLPILGGVLLVAGIIVAELELAVIGTLMTVLSGVGLWLAWRRRRRFGA